MSADLLSNPNNFNVNLKHGVDGVANVVGYPTRLWYAAKKYSINGTISTVAINTWVQFSLSYIAAIMITRNDLSFLTNILDPSAISLYALVSLVLVAAFLTSVTTKYIHKQEIKDEDFINEEIRGGQSDGINHLAQDVRAIEIFPGVRHITDKKISIIVPIAEKQGTALENQAAENRNKVIFITIPYVISSLIVTIALGKFGFANIRGWEEISFISMVVAIAVVGALVALSKLKDNKIKQMSNTTVKFGSPNIIPFFNTFVPFSKGKTVLVMENKVESSEDNDIVSRALKLVDKRLTDFIGVIDNSVLKPLSTKAQKTLDGVRADIRNLFNTLGANITKDVGEIKTTADKAITACLQNIANSVSELCKGVEKGVKDKLDKANVEEIMILVNHFSKLAKTLEDRLARLVPGKIGGLAAAGFSNERMPNARVPDECYKMLQMYRERMENSQKCIENLQKKLKEVQDQYENTKATLEAMQEVEKPLAEREQKKQDQTDQEDSGHDSLSESGDGDNAAHPSDNKEDELRKIREELQELQSQERIRILQTQIKELEAKHAEEEKQEERGVWKEALNGPPRAFFHHLFGSIDVIVNGEKVSLQDLDKKIVIHWKNGSKTTCYITEQEKTVKQPEKEVAYPRTSLKKPNPNPNIKAMYVAACPG